MLTTAVGRPGLFELLDVRTCAGDPARGQRLGDELHVARRDHRLVDGNQKRSFSAPPGYGPCLISSSTRSCCTRNPWPPPTETMMSPVRIARVATSSRS